MKQKLAVFLLALFFLAYASIIGVTAFRIVSARADGVRGSESDFLALGDLVRSSLVQGKDVRSKIFIEQMRSGYSNSPLLRSLVVRDASLKVVYAIPANAERPAVGTAPGLLAGFLAPVSPYSVMARRASIAIPGAPSLGIEAVYTILPTYKVQDVLSLSLLLSVALFLVSIFICLITALSGGDDEPAPAFIRETVPEFAAASGAFAASGGAFSASPRLSEEFEVPSFDMDPGPLGGYPMDGAVSPSPSPDGPSGLYSPRSGLGWEPYLAERLGSELSRCASLGLDCSFLLIECPGLSPEDPAYRRTADSIKEFFSFKDISFESGDSGFAVVLPGKDIEQALQAARDFYPSLPSGARIGISSRSGRRVDASVILQEARSALERAGSSSDSPVIGFKADAERYRNFVSGKL